VYQIRIHGRGGQGVVTAAELLSVAAFAHGRHAQAFPIFGSERTGAPVVAFCRINESPIRLREPIGEPDAVIVIDTTLLKQVDVFGGLKTGGDVLFNCEGDWSELGLTARPGGETSRVLTVPATRLALTHVGRPVPNAAMLAGFAAVCPQLVSLDGVIAAIRERFPASVAEKNVAAANEAFEFVAAQLKERAHA
jgi:pyruvate ferredoxin oxidoreductase gamma subunit